MMFFSLLFTSSIVFGAPVKHGMSGGHSSPGFNWKHAAVGAGVGIGASALWNQHKEINQLQDQIGGGGAAISSPAVVLVPQTQATSQQPADENGLIHSVKDQELILNTDAGPKIFLQKN